MSYIVLITSYPKINTEKKKSETSKDRKSRTNIKEK